MVTFQENSHEHFILFTSGQCHVVLYWSLRQKEKKLVILILSLFKFLMFCSEWNFYINFDFLKHYIKILFILII